MQQNDTNEMRVAVYLASLLKNQKKTKNYYHDDNQSFVLEHLGWPICVGSFSWKPYEKPYEKQEFKKLKVLKCKNPSEPKCKKFKNMHPVMIDGQLVPVNWELNEFLPFLKAYMRSCNMSEHTIMNYCFVLNWCKLNLSNNVDDWYRNQKSYMEHIKVNQNNKNVTMCAFKKVLLLLSIQDGENFPLFKK